MLTHREFFHDLITALREHLPPALSTFHVRHAPHLVKVYYTDPRLHYEVWLNGAVRQIELGFHFEIGPELVEQLLDWLDQYSVELKDLLGPETELERWTPSWGHLFQLWPYQPLSETLVQRLARHLAQFIIVVEPLVREWQAALPRTMHHTAAANPRRPMRVSHSADHGVLLAGQATAMDAPCRPASVDNGRRVSPLQ